MATDPRAPTWQVPAPGPATGEPVGRLLAATAKAVDRALDDSLLAAGGSLTTWLVLLAVRSGGTLNQRELAVAIGIEGPTLTHHLNRMEIAGLLFRRRDPVNRRVHHVQLTAAGEELFTTLLVLVVAFDRRLRAGIDDDDLDRLRVALGRLRTNAANATDASSPRS